jgi:hypothetical protein
MVRRKPLTRRARRMIGEALRYYAFQIDSYGADFENIEGDSERERERDKDSKLDDLSAALSWLHGIDPNA